MGHGGGEWLGLRIRIRIRGTTEGKKITRKEDSRQGGDVYPNIYEELTPWTLLHPLPTIPSRPKEILLGARVCTHWRACVCVPVFVRCVFRVLTTRRGYAGWNAV